MQQHIEGILTSYRKFDENKLLILSSPSWIRGGRGASMPPKVCALAAASTPLPTPLPPILRATSPLGGGAPSSLRGRAANALNINKYFYRFYVILNLIYLLWTGRIDMWKARRWSINSGVKSSPLLLLNLKIQAVTTPSLTP